ncbi:YtxH domain-containing protein [Halarcobacter bivalviorum]|uniref:YtxH domain-containing protein n=1 Tax=Halarcobacter bivalviorum TaxID=663364 RepID=UPI002B05F6D0
MNQNNNQNMNMNQMGMNPNQQNMYDLNIDNTRVGATPSMNINQNPYINPQPNQQQFGAPATQNQGLFNNSDFVKGALIGAAVTFLLTNKGAQETIMKAASKGSELFQAGMEELKERYEDAKAQMEANQNQ